MTVFIDEAGILVEPGWGGVQNEGVPPPPLLERGREGRSVVGAPRPDGMGLGSHTHRSPHPGTPKDELVEAGRGPGAGVSGASGTRTHGLAHTHSHALSARGPALRASANDLVQIKFKGDRRSSAPRRLSLEKGGRRGSKEDRKGERRGGAGGGLGRAWSGHSCG